MIKKILKAALILVAIFAVVCVAGYAYLYNNGLSGQYSNSEAKEGQIKVACVGDSVTYGHGIENWTENNYPAQLQKLLGEEYHVANFGSSGACVNPNGDQPYVSRDIYQESLDYEADILIFMIGTNDSKPENWINSEAFINEYVKLLKTYLQGENPPKVYIGLCSECYWIEETDSPLCEYDIQPAIVDEIVLTIQNAFETNGVETEVIDIHSMTEAHPEWFEKDGVHPNKDGAKAIAEAVAEAIKGNKEIR